MVGKMMKISFVTDVFKAYEKIELKAEVTGLEPELNVYDEKDVDLNISLISPGGKRIVLPAFYYEDFVFSDDGTLIGKSESEGDFRFRISLPEAAVWDFAVTLKIKGKTVDNVNGSITVEENYDNHGYLSVEPGKRQNFVFSDGRPFVAIGENIAYAALPEVEKRSAKLIEWMKKCADNGADFVRTWLIYWGLTVQKTDQAPNDFSAGLSDAAQLDRVFDAWRDMGMYGQFCLYSFNHLNNTPNSCEAAWSLFPYNSENKHGYLSEPMEFFTDEKAIADTKSFFRYLIARYSYSVNLFSWEFFNEIDGASGTVKNSETVIKWHKMMTDYIRSVDPYGHMITTSTACRPSNAEVNDEELKNSINAQAFFDYASIHYYNYDTLWDLADYQSKFQRLYSRPVMYGECGVTSVLLDKDLITLHQQNWISIMAGGAGTAATWYWEKLDEFDGYGHFKPIREITDMIPWNSAELRNIVINDLSSRVSGEIRCLGYKSENFACFWLYDTEFTQSTKKERNISGVEFTVKLNNGKYRVKWIDTWTGNAVSETEEYAKDGVLRLTAPEWSKDVAVVIS